MEKFFNTLKKGLVATLFVVVGFAMTYVPQLPGNQVTEAQASGLGGVATEFSQLAGNAVRSSNLVQTTITAGATTNLWLKENILDGIGWAIAKRVVSGMVRSLINWVNSGFQGSPAFVSDLKGFLLNTADEAIGDFIQNNLGDIGSFICSPFRLDVQISVALQYAQGRSGQTAPTCTLSGIVANIEGFIAGIDPGAGLSDWLQITSTPQTYTPYGAILNAEVEARARLINAQGQVLTEVNWGDGFLSQKICEAVEGSSNGSSCSISKPGRVIADQLNKALGAGQDTLIEADEINELVAALLGQLANKALTGVSGLLGLSGGTGFTESGYDGSYLDSLLDEAESITDSNNNNTNARVNIVEQLDLKIEYRDLLIAYRGVFQDFVDAPIPVDPNLSNSEQQDLEDAVQQEKDLVVNVIADIDSSLTAVESDIVDLAALAFEYNTADANRQVEILIEYTAIERISNTVLSTDKSQFDQALNSLGIAPPAIEPTTDLSNLMSEINSLIVVNPVDQNWAELAADLNLNL